MTSSDQQERTTEEPDAEARPNSGAIEALQDKIDADLRGIHIMRTLQAALRAQAGTFEEPLTDPENPAASLRIGSRLHARVTLVGGRTATLTGTAVSLIEKREPGPRGRRVLEVHLYDGVLKTTPDADENTPTPPPTTSGGTAHHETEGTTRT